MESINFVRRFFVVLVLAIVVSACSGSPTGPGKVEPPPVPRDGNITIWYERPAGLTCRAAGTQWSGHCNFPIGIQNPDWPEGYRIELGTKMEIQPDGRYAITLRAPSSTWAGDLKAYVIDSYYCLPQQICGNESYTGIGVSVNSVRLPDKPSEFAFRYVPPDMVEPR